MRGTILIIYSKDLSKYVYLYTDISHPPPPLQTGTVTGSIQTGEEKR
jgi:hypothetical protein